jgi:hypothetical protein
MPIDVGEKLQVKEVEGIGDKRIVEGGRMEKVGAGGLLGGVRFAVSDQKTQKQNKDMLKAFFRKEQKRRKQQEKERQRQQEVDQQI